MSRLYLGEEEKPSIWERIKRLDLLNSRVFVFIGGFGAGFLATIVLTLLSRDPGRAWSQLWEPVGLPAWVLAAALIFTLLETKRRGG